MPHVVVFDTNILLSAIGWKGTPFECLELARQGAVEGLTCWEILDELADKLKSKLAFDDLHTQHVLVDLLTFLRVVPIAGQLKAVHNDPDDDKVLECAMAGNATHLVTGDRRHLLPMGNFKGVRILTAAEFLKFASTSL